MLLHCQLILRLCKVSCGTDTLRIINWLSFHHIAAFLPMSWFYSLTDSLIWGYFPHSHKSIVSSI